MPKCASDFTEHTFQIYSGSAAPTVYRANDADMKCDETGPMLSYATAQPFIESLGCVGAGATRLGNNTAADALTVLPNTGCQHGIFAAAEGNTVWLKVRVSDPTRAHRFEALECAQHALALAFYDATGTNVLAQGARETGPACAAVEHTFPTAGDYLIRIEKAASRSAGDYYVRATTR